MPKLLSALLDARLEAVVSNDEYVAKKNKLLNQKLDLEAKLKEIERNGSRWLELCRDFIRESSEAVLSPLPANFSKQKNRIKKVGSNPTLRTRTLALDFKMPWQILAKSDTVRRSRTPFLSETHEKQFWLGDRGSNPDTQVQNLMSYH